MRLLIFACAFAFVSLTMLSGCGSSAQKETWRDATGTVTANGEMVPEGTITFEDVAGNAIAAEITDGKFTIALKPDTYKVRISVMEEYGEARDGCQDDEGEDPRPVQHEHRVDGDGQGERTERVRFSFEVEVIFAYGAGVGIRESMVHVRLEAEQSAHEKGARPL